MVMISRINVCKVVFPVAMWSLLLLLYVNAFVGLKNVHFPRDVETRRSFGFGVKSLCLKASNTSDGRRSSKSTYRGHTKQRHEQYSTRQRQIITTKKVNSTSSISLFEADAAVEERRYPDQIKSWMQNLPSGSFDGWIISDQITFVKLLGHKAAYESILMFLDSLDKHHVYVYTTAAFSLASSPNNIRNKASSEILNRLERNNVRPTSLTFIALLSAVDGPVATANMMKQINSYKVTISAEVYDSAIYACCRQKKFASSVSDGYSDDASWQAAMNLVQQMRQNGLRPTSKTYLALLQALVPSGKVAMAMALMQQWAKDAEFRPDERVWATAINVCAQAGDCRNSIKLIDEMISYGCQPNLRHCTGLIKALAKAGRDKAALQVLNMMLGNNTNTDGGDSTDEESGLNLRIPEVAPDLVLVNTVMSACSKARNFDGAKTIFEMMEGGTLRDPTTETPILPDRISYHYFLSSCLDVDTAKGIVRKMRLTRRHRHGVIPPTGVTYTHAINVCKRANPPDLDGVDFFLLSARDDGIEPTEFMYSSAIWVAQKCQNRTKALQYFHDMQVAGCEPNSVSYFGVISTLCSRGDVEEAVSMFEKMKAAGHEATPSILTCLAGCIRSLSKLPEKQVLLERVVTQLNGAEKRASVGGALFELLISVYGAQGMFDEALGAYQMISGRIADTKCLRAILLSCSLVQPARWQEAVNLLHTSDIMEGTKGPAKIDQIALSNAIIACCKADEIKEALNLLRLYGLTKRQRPSSLVPVSLAAMNSLVAACGRCGRPDLSLSVLNDMEAVFGVRPDVRSYRRAVIACNQAEHEKRRQMRSRRGSTTPPDAGTDSPMQWWECALALLRRMREEGIDPDTATFSSVISACEAAGQWQRALGILQLNINDSQQSRKDGEVVGYSQLNLYCFNAAISACEKGGAWVEALDLYERMLEIGGRITPNFVTLSSLIVALDKAGQKELAQSKYEEGHRMKIVKPWRWTKDLQGQRIRALDLHRFSAPMAKAAIRSAMDSFLERNNDGAAHSKVLTVITGKGKNSENDPVLKDAVLSVLEKECGVSAQNDEKNSGRLVVALEELDLGFEA